MNNILLSNLLSKYYQTIESRDPTIKHDIQSIVCDVLGVDKTHLYINTDISINNYQLISLEDKIGRLLAGEPLAYIVGYQYFWDQKLLVTKDTLIPRADTEVIVQLVLDDILDKTKELRILDLGTGTGAIALALAGELPNSHITAVDVSDVTLAVAIENAKLNNISNVSFIQSSWYYSLCDQQFDIIVSNPPYIDIKDSEIDIEVKIHEPDLALFSKDEGLHDIKMIVAGSKSFLKNNGMVYIEHGLRQSKGVTDIFMENGFTSVGTIKDLNGLDRCTRGCLAKLH